MRKTHGNFINLKVQATTVTLRQGKELVVNIPGNPEKPLIYKKTAKRTTEQIIYVLINPVLPLKLITKKPTAYGYK